MSRPNRLSILLLLIVLSITAVFAFIVVSIMYQPGPVSIAVTLVMGILAALFFAALTLVGSVLLMVMLADRIHHYAVLREKRELLRQELLARRNKIARKGYRYIPRNPKILRFPLNDPKDNGC